MSPKQDTTERVYFLPTVGKKQKYVPVTTTRDNHQPPGIEKRDCNNQHAMLLTSQEYKCGTTITHAPNPGYIF